MHVFPLALLVALASCSLAGPGSIAPEADGTLVNATEATLWPLAVDAETATLIDINPEMEIDPDDAIAPGESAPLTIQGGAVDEGVVVFVYRVEGTRATFATTLAIDGEAFERADGVVTVREL